MRLAMEGDLLQKHGADAEGAKRLIIVSSFKPNGNGQEMKGRVADILQEYNVKNITEEKCRHSSQRVEGKPTETGRGRQGLERPNGRCHRLL